MIGFLEATATAFQIRSCHTRGSASQNRVAKGYPLLIPTHLAQLKGNRPIGADGIWHEVGQNHLEPIDGHRAKQCIALIDQVQH